jgi:hypothetical protein
MAQEMVGLQSVHYYDENDASQEYEAQKDPEEETFFDEEGAPTDDDDHDDNPPPSFERIRLLRSILLWTIVLEGLTCVLRFGFGMQSTRDTAASVGRLTGGIRIHHGYAGILLVIGGQYCSGINNNNSTTAPCHRWMAISGWSLIASDLTHHFLVLWPITGSPQFDLTYPK